VLSRVLWRLITPRQLRRVTLVILVSWLAAAYLHHSGTMAHVRDQLPRQVPNIEMPTAPAFAPRYSGGY
jgi:hypothetical protein